MEPEVDEWSAFWDQLVAAWPILAIFLGVTVLASIGMVVWTVLQPDEPVEPDEDPVDAAVAREHARAQLVLERLDADAGRADPSDPKLR